mgnify:CR=1 FL=1
MAPDLSNARDVLYLGRDAMFAVALEGGLKLKEISYIHAERHAAGGLKQGSIALVGETTPVVVLASLDDFFERTVSNMQEIAARGGPVVLITDAPERAPDGPAARLVRMPAGDRWRPQSMRTRCSC